MPRKAGPGAYLRVAAIAGVVGGLVVALWLASTPVPESRTWTRGELISRAYDPPTRPVEAMLDRGDGQLFATQAMDPLVRRPEVIRGGHREAAYRFQRPLYGWLGWAASGGQSSWAPWALVALSTLSVALLAGVLAWAFGTVGQNPSYGLVALALPGAFADLTWVGPEALGAALVVAGLLLWARGERSRWLAIGCFAVAGLARETMLLTPAALCLLELGRRRPLRSILPLAASALPYAAWVLVLHARLGAWPVGSVGGRTSPVPFGGLVQAAGSWGVGDAVVAALVLGPAVAALALRRAPALTAVIGANLLLAATCGQAVWHRAPDYGRVLLPMCAVSVVALADRACCFERAASPARVGADRAQTRSTAGIGSSAPVLGS